MNLASLRKSEVGLTLIELCVYTALFLILTAISLPHLKNFNARHSLRTAAELVSLQLTRAYQSAVILNAKQFINIEHSAIKVLDENGNLIETNYLPRNVNFMPPTPDRIQFNPGFNSTPSRILLRSGSESCEITLSLRGRVEIKC